MGGKAVEPAPINWGLIGLVGLSVELWIALVATLSNWA